MPDGAIRHLAFARAMNTILVVLVIDVPVLVVLCSVAAYLKRRFPTARIRIGSFAMVGIAAIGTIHSLFPTFSGPTGRDYISALLFFLLFCDACRRIAKELRNRQS